MKEYSRTSSSTHGYLLLVLSDERRIPEVDISDGEHGGSVPLDEPINRTAVDERRVHAAAVPELDAGRAHRQHDVHVLLDALDEELEDGLARVGHERLGRRRLQVHHDTVTLLVVEQVRHLARVQDAVDVLQEHFLRGQTPRK